MLRFRAVDVSSLHLVETKPKIPAWMSRVLEK